LYKSIIEDVCGKLQTQMTQEDEEMVLKAIRKVGINVDKEALIKALQYDRDQYIKGYEDGKNEVLSKIRDEILEKSYEGYGSSDFRDGYNAASVNFLNILDKCKSEVEPKESE
jgi:hypothetical protein